MFEFLGCILLIGLIWAGISCFPWSTLVVAFVLMCAGLRSRDVIERTICIAIAAFVAVLAGITLIFHITPLSILHFTLGIF